MAPNSRYKKCIRATRVLNLSMLKRKYGEVSQFKLFSAVEVPENLLTEFKERELTNPQSNDKT